MNRLIHIFVKLVDIRLCLGNAVAYRKLPQGVHDGRDVDTVGALRGTGMAPHANPDRPAAQSCFALVELDKAQDMVGQQIHVLHERTAGTAGPAVPAKVNCLPGHVVDDLFETTHRGRRFAGSCLLFKMTHDSNHKEDWLPQARRHTRKLLILYRKLHHGALT